MKEYKIVSDVIIPVDNYLLLTYNKSDYLNSFGGPFIKNGGGYPPLFFNLKQIIHNFIY